VFSHEIQKAGGGKEPMRIIEPSELTAVRATTSVQHVAIIMDGNRRWAAAREIELARAYERVAQSILSCFREAMAVGVQRLTFFALSPRNLLRPAPELAVLTELHKWLWAPHLIDELVRNSARVTVVGSPHPLLEGEFTRAEKWIAPLAINTTIDVSFAVNYSSTANHSTEFIPLGSATIPDVDLLIRTGGDKRLSDFLLAESAYAELVFTDTLWPDFTGLHLASALAEFGSRQRRFGR
jgi:undecaprenyl diphosphate synthase